MSILRAETLKCEYRDDVPCVDDPAPRLSWTLASDRRDERQTAYRIVAALGEADVRAGRGTLWDSGRVASGESLGIPYAGRPLPAGAEIVWAVQVWSRDGEVSGWSAPARFRTGLAAWRARWIRRDHDGDPGVDAPTETNRTENRELAAARAHSCRASSPSQARSGAQRCTPPRAASSSCTSTAAGSATPCSHPAGRTTARASSTPPTT